MNNFKELKCWTFKSFSRGIDGLNFTIWNNVIASHYLYKTVMQYEVYNNDYVTNEQFSTLNSIIVQFNYNLDTARKEQRIA